MITNYKTLEVTMEEASHGIDDFSRRASGVATLMKKIFNFLWIEGLHSSI